MEQDIIEIDSDRGVVLLHLHNEFDPSGQNVIVEYTIAEWSAINSSNSNDGQ